MAILTENGDFFSLPKALRARSLTFLAFPLPWFLDGIQYEISQVFVRSMVSWVLIRWLVDNILREAVYWTFMALGPYSLKTTDPWGA